MALDFLKVKEKDAVRVPWQTLRAQTVAILRAVNVPKKHAEITADILIKSDLFGVDSHGSNNVIGYAAQVQKKNWTIPQRIKVISESESGAVISNGNGLGFVGAHRAMEMAIEKAADVGVGMVSVRDGHHIGMVGYYPLMAIEHDMLGMAMTNGASSVRPAMAARARLGTNPIAFGAPAGEEKPFLFDAAMSTVASGKLGIARRLGVKIPAGWAVDAEGDPITVPPPERSEMWAQNPLGNTREQGAHKGYGLAVMVDILTGILSGGGFSAQQESGGNQTWCMAVDISRFRPVDEFKAHMDEMIRELHSTPPEPGVDRVLVAGDPEWESEAERKANGIPLHRSIVQNMTAKAKEVGAEVLL